MTKDRDELKSKKETIQEEVLDTWLIKVEQSPIWSWYQGEEIDDAWALHIADGFGEESLVMGIISIKYSISWSGQQFEDLHSNQIQGYELRFL